MFTNFRDLEIVGKKSKRHQTYVTLGCISLMEFSTPYFLRINSLHTNERHLETVKRNLKGIRLMLLLDISTSIVQLFFAHHKLLLQLVLNCS